MFLTLLLWLEFTWYKKKKHIWRRKSNSHTFLREKKAKECKKSPTSLESILLIQQCQLHMLHRICEFENKTFRVFLWEFYPRHNMYKRKVRGTFSPVWTRKKMVIKKSKELFLRRNTIMCWLNDLFSWKKNSCAGRIE